MRARSDTCLARMSFNADLLDTPRITIPPRVRSLMLPRLRTSWSPEGPSKYPCFAFQAKREPQPESRYATLTPFGLCATVSAIPRGRKVLLTSTMRSLGRRPCAVHATYQETPTREPRIENTIESLLFPFSPSGRSIDPGLPPLMHPSPAQPTETTVRDGAEGVPVPCRVLGRRGCCPALVEPTPGFRHGHSPANGPSESCGHATDMCHGLPE